MSHLLTVKALKERLKEKNIPFPHRARKAVLVELLEGKVAYAKVKKISTKRRARKSPKKSPKKSPRKVKSPTKAELQQKLKAKGVLFLQKHTKEQLRRLLKVV